MLGLLLVRVNYIHCQPLVHVGDSSGDNSDMTEQNAGKTEQFDVAGIMIADALNMHFKIIDFLVKAHSMKHANMFVFCFLLCL